MNVFLHKGTQVWGVPCTGQRHRKVISFWPAVGVKAERKRSCLGVIIMSHPEESGEAQFESFTIKQSFVIEL